MRHYFCGWYFRCQSERQTLAVIPSIHKTREKDFCTIQVITDTEAFSLQLPYSAYRKSTDRISIAGNRFSPEGITLDIQTKALRASGTVSFGAFTPLRYDIMGPFRYVPLMQCRHSVYSMRHTVDGELSVNGILYPFQNATGYIEGDRGYSFPKNYIWTQCSFPDGALMLSVADIPLGALHFTGVIGVVYLRGKEYRLATYLGAKAVKIARDKIIVRQGSFTLTVHPEDVTGHSLLAPISGVMSRRIHEHPSCHVHFRFEKDGIHLLDLNASNAAFEYEY